VTFNGFPFLLCFLPSVLCGYAVFGRLSAGWAKSWLISASLVFYAAGAPAFVPRLLCSVGGNFMLLRIMHGSARAGRWAAVGVAVNLARLAWFKYVGPDSIPPLD
jgi:alginate O-acetyltransferase complex protein AlgI